MLFFTCLWYIGGLGFLNIAIRSACQEAELTLVDPVVCPDGLVASSSGYRTRHLLWFAAKKVLNSFLLGLPFSSPAYFILLVSVDGNKEFGQEGFLLLLKENTVGSYIAGLASLLLLFSTGRHETLHTDRKWCRSRKQEIN